MAQATGRLAPQASGPALAQVPDHVRHGKSGAPRQVPAPPHFPSTPAFCPCLGQGGSPRLSSGPFSASESGDPP